MDQLQRDIAEIKVTLVRQEANLAEHMRRTDAAEARVAHAETQVTDLRTFVTETKAYMRTVKWLCVGLGGLITAAAGVAAIVGVIHGW